MKKKYKSKENQLQFQGVNGWGGKRKNAGRPNKSGLVNHMKRPKISHNFPLHLNLKLKEKLPSLRKKILLQEFQKCIELAKNQGLYVIHFSIQSNHIHLFAEAKNNQALALGMRSLAGRFAKIIRAYAASSITAKNKGSVFRGRYFVHVLKTPMETKNALEYVLLNTSKHQKLIEHMDLFSSARDFKHWDKLLGKRYASLIKGDAEFYKKGEMNSPHERPPSEPRSWLAKTGWMRATSL